MIPELIGNIRASIYNLKIQEKQYRVTEGSPVLKAYFARLPTGEYGVYNGYIVNDADVTLDIAREKAWNYLKRAVWPWRDCVKLRYGLKREDSPALWTYMETYVSTAAHLFDALRIDNAHSTPLPVLRHLIHLAKRIRPDILIMAEVFAPSQAQEQSFLLSGADLITKESIHCHHSHDFVSLLNTLKTAYLPYILFDFSHDNDIPGVWEIMPRTAIVSFATGPVASCKGVDEFMGEKIKVVGENRLYPEVSMRLGEENEGIDGGTRMFIVYRDGGKGGKVEVKGAWDGWRSVTRLQ